MSTWGDFPPTKPPQRKKYAKPTYFTQKEEPSGPHHDAVTSSSCWRSDISAGYQPPKDSLDFQLASIYDHHNDLFWDKSEVICQKVTISEDPRKKLAEIKEQEKMKKDEVRVWVDPQRWTIHSIK